jgi:hypothetical protein
MRRRAQRKSGRTLVEHGNSADRRRNVFDIVADLGFLDRKPLPRADSHAPPAGPALGAPPTPAGPAIGAPPPLTLVKPPPPAPPPAPVTMRVEGPHSELAQTLTDAQQRAAQHRIAAERMLQEAVELERRLADEAAQARAANEQALARELAIALDDARTAEQEATGRAEVCDKNLERAAAQRARAEALQADDHTARIGAADDVAATEARLAEARRRFEIADAACTESAARFNDACAAEEAARAEAIAASGVTAACRAAREEMEERLRGIEERAAAFTGNVPSLATVEQLHALEARSAIPAGAATRIAERRAADAAKRIAERQAADAQRGEAS